MQRDIDALADELVRSVRGLVDPLISRINDLERRFADPSFGAAGERGERGERGEKGDPGPEGLRGMEGPVGPTGEAGPQGEKGEVGPAGPAGPPGERGADGAPGEKGDQGPQGPAGETGARGPAGERGIDGKDGVDGAMGPVGPAGRDGADGLHGKDGDPGRDGRDGRDGTDGKDGKDGAPGERGLDALEITILPDIDTRKSYPRGTYASFRGGLVRAARKTDPMGEQPLSDAGWTVVIDGLDAITVTQLDERQIELVVTKTSGAASSGKFAFPVLIDRGVYRSGTDYLKGDCVTYGGSVWIAQRDTADRPETGDSWRLAVKRGRDGKDGAKGDRGPEGKKGEDGLDLTQMAFDGTRY